MNAYLYESATGLFVLTVICVFILIITGIVQAFKREVKGKSVAVKVAAGLMAWLGVLGILANNGFFQNFQVLPPRFAVAVLPPVALVIFLLFSAKFSKFLGRLSPAKIIALQSFRVVVEVVLWLLFLHNTLPVQMSFEGRNFDVLVGLTAPFMAWYVSRQKAGYRTIAIIWNIAGLGLVLNIVIISILSTPSPFRVFMNEPANTFIARLPFIWLPGFLVPVAIAGHLFSLKQLAGIRKAVQPNLNLQQVAR